MTHFNDFVGAATVDDRFQLLEDKISQQNDEIITLKASLADVLKRLQDVEMKQASSSPQQQLMRNKGLLLNKEVA